MDNKFETYQQQNNIQQNIQLIFVVVYIFLKIVNSRPSIV